MSQLYAKNLHALQSIHPILYRRLAGMEENRKFELYTGEKPEDINLLDTRQGVVMYDHPHREVESQKAAFKEYREYDFLYFFGIGNGLLIAALLENEKHRQIVVIEPEPEILFIGLHLIDLSEALRAGRLRLVCSEDLDFATAVTIFMYRNAPLYARVYALHANNSYYASLYAQTLVAVNRLLVGGLEYVLSVVGNSVIDQFVGLRQHVRHIPDMLHHPPLVQLAEKKNSETAIIVATGPSLHKQLPLLKRIKDYVTIISVDASLPILEKHAIKPDFVTSMERDEISDIFHKQTSADFQEGIVFVCASLQHDNVFYAIKNGSVVYAMRPYQYNRFLELDDYGYVCSGMSSANMAHELAIYMKFKTAVFIGQDLAYGRDGSSHSKEYALGEDYIKEGVMQNAQKRHYEEVEMPAYGGEGTVKSIRPWKLFKDGLEFSVQMSASIIRSINATEGGARIEGTEEMPFDKVAENFVDYSRPKRRIVLKDPLPDQYGRLKQHADRKVRLLLEEGQALLETVQSTFLQVAEACKPFENKSMEEAEQVLDIAKTLELLDMIENVRNKVEKSPVYLMFYHDILQSTVVHQELELAEIKVRAVHNPHENQVKAIQWILAHRYWLFSLAGGIHNAMQIIREEYRFD